VIESLARNLANYCLNVDMSALVFVAKNAQKLAETKIAKVMILKHFKSISAMKRMKMPGSSSLKIVATRLRDQLLLNGSRKAPIQQ
jgi:hypothetical protein